MIYSLLFSNIRKYVYCLAGMAAILHNVITVATVAVMQRYVTLLWAVFMHSFLLGVALWSCEARASCKVLHVRRRIKNCMAVAGGRAKKTVQAVRHERRGFFALGSCRVSIPRALFLRTLP
mgnify:CR=1 FL=1